MKKAENTNIGDFSLKVTLIVTVTVCQFLTPKFYQEMGVSWVNILKLNPGKVFTDTRIICFSKKVDHILSKNCPSFAILKLFLSKLLNET